MGNVYSEVLLAEAAMVGGTVYDSALDPAYRWILRDVTGEIITINTGGASLTVTMDGIVVVDVYVPENVIWPFTWEGRVVGLDITGVAAILQGAPSVSGSIKCSGYRLTLP